MQLKKILFAILLLPCFAQAQWMQNPFLRDLKIERHQIVAGYGYRISSTALTNRLYNDYLFTPFIEDSVKRTVLPKLKDKNYFGGYRESQFIYSWKPKKNQTNNTQYALYAGVKSRNQQGAMFTPDVYRVLFFGNKDYASRTAIGDGSYYIAQSFQTLQGGVIFETQKNRDGQPLRYGGGIGLVKGGKLLALSADELSLYTSNNGDSIHVRALADGSYSQKGLKNTAFTGAGLSANFFLHVPINPGTIAISVSDLGFIRYAGSKTARFSADEEFSFTGYKIDSNFNISSSSKFVLDSLKERAESLATRQEFSRMLPAQLQLAYTLDPSRYWRIEAGAEYIAYTGGRVELYGLGTIHVHENFTFSAGAHALGFGYWGVITHARVTLKKKIQVIIGSENIEAWLLNKDKTTSQSAYGQLRFAF